MSTDEQIDLIMKSSQLTTIEERLDLLDRGQIGPRPQLARIAGIVVGICSIIWLYSKTGSPVQFWGWSIIVFTLTFFIIHKMVIRFSSMPMTMTALIDEMLSKYEPIDIEAFRILQQKTIEFGYLKSDLLREWITQERLAGKNAVAKNRSEPLKFTSKSVDGLKQHHNNVRPIK